MNDILALASNDNIVTAIIFKDDLEINIETWDGKSLTVVCQDCLKLAVNVSPEVEIGEISFIGFSDLADDWELEFAKDDPGCSNYSEMIIYDPWKSSKKKEDIFMRVIAEKFSVKE